MPPEKLRSWATWYAVALLGLITSLIYSLNALQPLVSDDFGFYILDKNRGIIDNASNLFMSIVNMREYTPGRMLTNGLAAFFLMFDKSVYNVANTLATITLVISVVSFCSERLLHGKWLAVATALAILILSIPVASQALIWLDGSCNNLWPMLLVAVFLNCFFSKKRPLQILALFLAPFAGNAHEGFAIGLIGFLTAYMLLTCKRRHPLLRYIASILVIAGFLFHILSPGFRGHVGALEGSGINLFNIYQNLLSFVYLLSISLVRTCVILSIVIVALIILIRHIRQNHLHMGERTILAISLFAAASIQAVALISVGTFWSRAWLGVYFYLFLFSLMFMVPFIQMRRTCIQVTIATLTCALATYVLYAALPDARRNAEYAAYLNTQLEEGNRIIDNPMFTQDTLPAKPSRYVYDCLLSTADCFHWCNGANVFLDDPKPYVLVTPDERKTMESVSESLIQTAREGNIVMQGNDFVFYVLPNNTKSASVKTAEPAGKQKNVSHLAWPLNQGYGLMFPLPTDGSTIHISWKLDTGSMENLELSLEHIKRLKCVGSLPVEPLKQSPAAH